MPVSFVLSNRMYPLTLQSMFCIFCHPVFSISCHSVYPWYHWMTNLPNFILSLNSCLCYVFHLYFPCGTFLFMRYGFMIRLCFPILIKMPNKVMFSTFWIKINRALCLPLFQNYWNACVFSILITITCVVRFEFLCGCFTFDKSISIILKKW